MSNNRIMETAKNLNKVFGANNIRVLNNKSASGLLSLRNILLVSVVLVFIIIAGMFSYEYIFKGKMGIFIPITTDIVPFIHDGRKNIKFSHGSLPLAGGYANYNFWIYITDYIYRKDEAKCIFFKGRIDSNSNMNSANLTDDSGHKNNGSPGAWLLEQTNTLRILVPLETIFEKPMNRPECYDSLGNKDGRNVQCNNKLKVQACDIENIPLQRWVNINVTMTDNILDVWMDGSLRKSCSLAGYPKVNEEPLHINPGGGFNGFISKFSVTNSPLSSNKIKQIYNNGPSLKPGFGKQLANAIF